MKKILLLTTIICLNLVCTCIASEPTTLPHILVELEKGRNKKYDETYVQTLDTLMEHPDMPQELLNRAIDILLFHPKNTIERFPLLQQRSLDIDKAIARFDIIPGFRRLLIKVISECCLKDSSKIHWHVLNTALFLHTQITALRSSERITAFGIPTDFDMTVSTKRLYNIITNQRWIECKSIKWRFNSFNRQGAKKSKLIKELLEQQALVATYNEQKNAHLSYELFSANPVNESWQTWLTDHDITCIVIPGPDDFKQRETAHSKALVA